MGGACNTNGGRRTRIGYWWENSEVKRPKHRWVHNIKINLGEIGWGWCALH
jgi:hypothetical protein